MFEFLAGFDKIIVTGPQRSGTTIAARMIANDLGLRFFIEERVPTRQVHAGLVQHQTGWVAQVPHLCRWVHDYGDRDDVAIVMVRRPIDEILASQARIGWAPYERDELARYGLQDGVISEVKYDFWEQEQKPIIRHGFEIDYHDLKEHPLWVPKRSRGKFAPRQHELTSIIIPCWLLPHNNNALVKHTKRCLDSIRRHTADGYELVLVDNGSVVGTRLLIQNADIYVRNTQNLGFAPAVNQGLKLATGQWLVVMNNDITVTKGWLTDMQRAWGDDIGAVCAHLDGQDPEHKAGVQEMQPMTMFGALWLTRREVVDRIGYMDEGYEMGMWEDRDYWMKMTICRLKFRKAGWCNHVGNATWGKLPRQREIFKKNRERFERRWNLQTS